MCMVAIGHAQYTWTLFVPSFQRTLQTDAAAVQLGFSCFVAMQTTSVLVLGLLLPSARHERSAMALGALMLFVSLHGLAGARSTARLNLSAALMGVGVGCAYNVCMATSVRTFSRHRGLAGRLDGWHSMLRSGPVATVESSDARIRDEGERRKIRVSRGSYVFGSVARAPSGVSNDGSIYPRDAPQRRLTHSSSPLFSPPFPPWPETSRSLSARTFRAA